MTTEDRLRRQHWFHLMREHASITTSQLPAAEATCRQLKRKALKETNACQASEKHLANAKAALPLAVVTAGGPEQAQVGVVKRMFWYIVAIFCVSPC